MLCHFLCLELWQSMLESHSTLPASFPSPLPPFVPLWLSRSFLLALTFPSFNDANDLMANLLRLGRKKESKGRRKRRLEQKAEGIVAMLVQINIFFNPPSIFISSNHHLAHYKSTKYGICDIKIEVTSAEILRFHREKKMPRIPFPPSQKRSGSCKAHSTLPRRVTPR